MSEIAQFSLLTGWSGILAGIISGAIIGLYFHKAEWLGGYASFQRRLIRLGHISFIGIGLLNLFFGVTAASLGEGTPASGAGQIGSVLLLIALIAMPTCCFLTAWKKPFRHFFFIPVLTAGGGVISAILLLKN